MGEGEDDGGGGDDRLRRPGPELHPMSQSTAGRPVGAGGGKALFRVAWHGVAWRGVAPRPAGRQAGLDARVGAAAACSTALYLC